MIKNFMTPLRSYSVEETVNPNARSAENKHFRGYFIEQNVHKICSHPISWFFLWPPYFSWKKSVTPQLFHDPPIQKKMIAPLAPKCTYAQVTDACK